VSKPIIAACTLPGLPGRPRHNATLGLAGMVDDLVRQVETLQEAGVDGLVFVNENDFPYTRSAGVEIVAAMAAAIGQVRPRIRIPFGVDVLWDPRATLAVARATGASFAREIFVGVFDTNMGLLDRDWGEIAAYRHAIAADDIAVFTYITAEYGQSVSGRSVADRAENAAFLGVDAILVSAAHSGMRPDLTELAEARRSAGPVPVIAATGVTHETAGAVLAVADGAIVGSDIRVDGSIWNAVDAARTRRLMQIVGEIRTAAQAPAGGA
jgi:membrane complex biogenesis BtpA family protein